MGALFLIMYAALCAHSAMAVLQSKAWGTVHSDEYCDYDTFRAQCSASEIIMIQRATYGHMRLGKCIETDLGYLGCEADVTDILDRKCTGKQSCELLITDQSLRQTKPCPKGVGVYMEASYACIKAIAQNMLCSPVRAGPEIAYIPSVQVSGSSCHGNREIDLHAEKGQRLDITLINVSTSSDGPLELGYAIDGDEGGVKPLVLKDAETHVGTSESNKLSLVLEENYNTAKYIIAYRAIGCPDIAPPPGTVFERHADHATVTCTYTQVSWSLTCRNQHWLGVIGNCTKPKATVPVTSRRPKEKKQTELALHKDVVYLIIICATIFLSVLVITIGCVSLKRARIIQRLKEDKSKQHQTAPQATSDKDWEGTTQMILLPKSRPNSDYLTPRYNPDGQGIDTSIYDTPLPDPPLVNTENRGTAKRNNDDDLINTMSSTSTDYTRKYFVLDKDYMNTKNLLDA